MAVKRRVEFGAGVDDVTEQPVAGERRDFGILRIGADLVVVADMASDLEEKIAKCQDEGVVKEGSSRRLDVHGALLLSIGPRKAIWTSEQTGEDKGLQQGQ